MDFLFAALGIIFAGIMTLTLAGAIYEHRSALPMVSFMFVAILIFGFIW